jgi:hypothetical protein
MENLKNIDNLLPDDMQEDYDTNLVYPTEAGSVEQVTPTNDSSNIVRCRKCEKRLARDGCTQAACLVCCTDLVQCESHKKPRALAQWKQDVLAGTTEIQQLASKQRRLRIPDTSKRFFRESGFVYQGDTVVIWNLCEFACNPKWRDDAIRKSIRRTKTTTGHNMAIPRLRINRRRFRQTMNDLFLASLTQPSC